MAGVMPHLHYVRAHWLTENAGHENGGPLKLQEMKMQDMKLQDKIVLHYITCVLKPVT